MKKLICDIDSWISYDQEGTTITHLRFRVGAFVFSLKMTDAQAYNFIQAITHAVSGTSMEIAEVRELYVKGRRVNEETLNIRTFEMER